MNRFFTKYGVVTLYHNEIYIGNEFKEGRYWDEDTLLKLKEYIDPDRNILEIGAHCGTSSLIYSHFLNQDKKLFAYEPQKNIYDLLVFNINQNNLQDKIIPINKGIFCFTGKGQMNDTDLDGGGGLVKKRYTEEGNQSCNFGGIGLGDKGETIQLTTMDELTIEDIGFIHCDAQGAENFIFSKGIETIKKHRPIIFYENNETYGQIFYNTVANSYPQYEKESKFDVKKYCMETLNYTKCIDRFNGGIDNLLLP